LKLGKFLAALHAFYRLDARQVLSRLNNTRLMCLPHEKFLLFQARLSTKRSNENKKNRNTQEAARRNEFEANGI
jgi:hypothetical protein